VNRAEPGGRCFSVYVLNKADDNTDGLEQLPPRKQPYELPGRIRACFQSDVGHPRHPVWRFFSLEQHVELSTQPVFVIPSNRAPVRPHDRATDLFWNHALFSRPPPANCEHPQSRPIQTSYVLLDPESTPMSALFHALWPRAGSRPGTLRRERRRSAFRVESLAVLVPGPARVVEVQASRSAEWRFPVAEHAWRHGKRTRRPTLLI